MADELGPYFATLTTEIHELGAEQRKAMVKIAERVGGLEVMFARAEERDEGRRALAAAVERMAGAVEAAAASREKLGQIQQVQREHGLRIDTAEAVQKKHGGRIFQIVLSSATAAAVVAAIMKFLP